MQVTSHGVTDIGLVRQNNEDRFAIEPILGLYVVCDGMGGHAGGEVAAGTAINSVIEYFRLCNDHKVVDEQFFAQRVSFAIKRASREIHFMATSDFMLNKMATTLTMLMLANEKAHIANVGDSRAYLIREGAARLLTTDQTIRNELLRQGYSPDDPLATGRFARMLTHSVGEGESVEAEVLSIDIRPGDRFLLCTDGLSKYFDDDDEIAHIVNHGRPHSATRDFLSLARRRGGSDNITAIVIAIEGPPKVAPLVWRERCEENAAVPFAFAS